MFTQKWFRSSKMGTEMPFNCYLAIASTSHKVWKSMLSIPSFSRFSITKEGKNFAEKCYSRKLIKEFKTIYYLGFLIHRNEDLPAIIHSDGTQEWYKNGRQHRDGDSPAYISVYGHQEWFKNGKCHRDGDLPAVISAGGYQAWYRNGRRHRDNDSPAIIWENGRQYWFRDGNNIRDPSEY